MGVPMKVSELAAVTALDGTEAFPLVQSAVTKKATIDQLFGPLQPWEDVGGSVGAFGAGNFGGGAVPIDLGADGVVLTQFGRIGSLCFATCRLKSSGAGAAGGTGAWTVTGLPVPIKMVGAGADGGQNVGFGFLLNGGAGLQKIPVHLTIDPGLPSADPFIFIDFKVSGGNLVPVDFSFGGNDIPAHDANPFDFVAGSIMNVTMIYEGDL